MDPENFEQTEIPKALIGVQARFLEAGMRLTVEFVAGRPINVLFPEVLEVKVHGLSLDRLLDKTVEETLALFQGETEIQEPLWVLERVGLGYVRLGQPLSTLSGGEIQRLKLARELSDRTSAATLFLLDEPTVGLHRKDVLVLLRVLRELKRRGSTVVLVEHNLDLLAACDYLIELGPEGGEAGGYLVAEGSPEEIARNEGSLTGRYLRRIAACA